MSRPATWNGSAAMPTASRSATSTTSCGLAASAIRTANSSPPQRATISCDGHGGPQPPGRLGQQQVAGPVADRVVHRGEAVQVQEDGRGRLRTGQFLGPLLQVGPVGQPGDAVVEGQVRDLAAQRDLVADVAGGQQQPVGQAGLAVAGDGGLDVPPGAVGGADPAGELGQPGRAVPGGQGHPGAPRPVLGVDQVGQRGAGQRQPGRSRTAPRPGWRTRSRRGGRRPAPRRWSGRPAR